LNIALLRKKLQYRVGNMCLSYLEHYVCIYDIQEVNTKIEVSFFLNN